MNLPPPPKRMPPPPRPPPPIFKSNPSLYQSDHEVNETKDTNQPRHDSYTSNNEQGAEKSAHQDTPEVPMPMPMPPTQKTPSQEDVFRSSRNTVPSFTPPTIIAESRNSVHSSLPTQREFINRSSNVRTPVPPTINNFQSTINETNQQKSYKPPLIQIPDSFKLSTDDANDYTPQKSSYTTNTTENESRHTTKPEENYPRSQNRMSAPIIKPPTFNQVSNSRHSFDESNRNNIPSYLKSNDPPQINSSYRPESKASKDLTSTLSYTSHHLHYSPYKSPLKRPADKPPRQTSNHRMENPPQNKKYFLKSIQELKNLLDKRIDSIQPPQLSIPPDYKETSYVDTKYNEVTNPSVSSYDPRLSQVDYMEYVNKSMIQPCLDKISLLERKFSELEILNQKMYKNQQSHLSQYKSDGTSEYTQSFVRHPLENRNSLLESREIQTSPNLLPQATKLFINPTQLNKVEEKFTEINEVVSYPSSLEDVIKKVSHKQYREHADRSSPQSFSESINFENLHSFKERIDSFTDKMNDEKLDFERFTNGLNTFANKINSKEKEFRSYKSQASTRKSQLTDDRCSLDSSKADLESYRNRLQSLKSSRKSYSSLLNPPQTHKSSTHYAVDSITKPSFQDNLLLQTNWTNSNNHSDFETEQKTPKTMYENSPQGHYIKSQIPLNNMLNTQNNFVPDDTHTSSMNDTPNTQQSQPTTNTTYFLAPDQYPSTPPQDTQSNMYMSHPSPEPSSTAGPYFTSYKPNNQDNTNEDNQDQFNSNKQFPYTTSNTPNYNSYTIFNSNEYTQDPPGDFEMSLNQHMDFHIPPSGNDSSYISWNSHNVPEQDMGAKKSLDSLWDNEVDKPFTYDNPSPFNQPMNNLFQQNHHGNFNQKSYSPITNSSTMHSNLNIYKNDYFNDPIMSLGHSQITSTDFIKPETPANPVMFEHSQNSHMSNHQRTDTQIDNSMNFNSFSNNSNDFTMTSLPQTSSLFDYHPPNTYLDQTQFTNSQQPTVTTNFHQTFYQMSYSTNTEQSNLNPPKKSLSSLFD